ncbi:MAG: ImmA/IrrE family metallo-endopeptidase [Caulobacteraceae bacterium]
MSLLLTTSRKKQIKSIAQNTLRSFNIEEPPVHPKSIVCRLGQLYNFSDPDEKGFTRFISGKYKIYINNVEYKDMSTWTYAHEAGHIILKHFINYKKYLSDEIGCAYIDKEANAFAAELLMPEEWVYKYIKQHPPSTAANIGKLYNLFNVSWESLLNRLDSLKIQRKKDSLLILSGSSSQENKVVPIEPQIADTEPEPVSYPNSIENTYKLFDIFKNITCIVCGNITNNPYAKYCAICGCSLLTNFTGDKEPVEYLYAIETDEYGHALSCPTCGNTEIADEHYCPNCNTYLIQECTNEIRSIDIMGNQEYKFSCGNIPDGNARYCECCGNKTSFYLQGLLPHWRKYQESQVANQTADKAAATKGS